MGEINKRFHFDSVCGDTGLIDEEAELKWWITNVCSITDLKDNWKSACDKLNQLNDENEYLIRKRGELETKNVILKGENERMTNKLNEIALEFLNHNMVSMGKATEMSEMSYHDFLKYRKENGNPMELQL